MAVAAVGTFFYVTAEEPQPMVAITFDDGYWRDWTNLDLGPVHDGFHIYKFVWEPGLVTFYRDDVEIAQHRNRVPSNPAPMFFNHWGTYNSWWGGIATPNTIRYMYVDWFRYTPLQ